MKGPGHYGVAVVRGEVMVCKCNNEGTVMVYDKEVNFVRSIQHSSIKENVFMLLQITMATSTSPTVLYHVYKSSATVAHSFAASQKIETG